MRYYVKRSLVMRAISMRLIGIDLLLCSLCSYRTLNIPVALGSVCILVCSRLCLAISMRSHIMAFSRAIALPLISPRLCLLCSISEKVYNFDPSLHAALERAGKICTVVVESLWIDDVLTIRYHYLGLCVLRSYRY